MPRAIEHSIETHGSIPIQPMHNLWQLFRDRRFEQIMNVIAHDADRIELEAVFLF
jgi:hypothetical protein